MTELDIVRTALAQAAELHQRVSADQAGAVVDAARAVRTALEAGRKVLVFGNGGSATDAQHFAAELVGRFTVERRGWPVIALTSDSAIVTAVANDYGYERVFARQVEALGTKGDVAMGITTSGTSANVNQAFQLARSSGLVTIGLTGRDGGKARGLVDVHVNVPGVTSAQVQEVHRTVLHVMCELIERGHA
jgi:D-sedoheptulose 7-phosphate isomerase